MPLQAHDSTERLLSPREHVTDVVDLDDVPFDHAYDIAIVGLGYVGLPTALALHDAGRIVLGVDVDPARIEAIRLGRVDVLDSDRERLAVAVGDDRFEMTSDERLLGRAGAVVVCVPTPIDEHLLPDLSILRSACAAVVAQAVPGQTIIVTSTTYVGCTRELLVAALAARGLVVGEDVFVAFSPERIDPGNDRHRQGELPRVVGGVTPGCAEQACQALKSTAGRLEVVSSPEAAEMAKLLENTFRAVNIALANEVADACQALGLDVMEVIAGAASKPYGFMAFYPGPGVGGHCIPCDPHYLLWQLRKHRLPTPVIEQAMAGIAARPGKVVERARAVLGQAGIGIGGARVLVVGVTYKPDIDDVRESPALTVIPGLIAAGARVEYHDPHVPRLRLPDGTVLEHTTDPTDPTDPTNPTNPTGRGYDLVVVHTAHSDVPLDWLLEHPLVLDTTYRLPGSATRAVL
jgi:UDP-N-acetyl-D-glucosamine dehydrogenase